MDRIELAVQAAGPMRMETLEGREYRVFPAVLVRPQVLHNNLGRTFLPPELITDGWARASNDAPVVLDHPTNRGFAVSAKSPEVLNARGVGRLYGVRVENGDLKGDVWIDVSRVGSVPELGKILAAQDAGQPTELSTGFPVSLAEMKGAYNGRDFDLRITDVGPLDHLAVFAEKRGACSVKDGCGLGVNHAGDCDAEVPEVDPPSVLTTSPEVPEPAANESGDHHPKESRMDREKLIAQLAAAGRKVEVLNELSDCDLAAMAGVQAPEPQPESEAWKLVAKYRAENETLKTRYEPVVENQEKERARLLDDVLAVNGRPWSDMECINMKYEELKKIHQALCQRPDFSLARGVFGTSQNLLSGEVKPFFGQGGVFTGEGN